MTENIPARGSRLMLAVVGIGVVAFFVALRYFHVQILLQRSLDWVAGLGPTGVVAFVVIYILVCVFMLPGSVLTLGAGAVFGVVNPHISRFFYCERGYRAISRRYLVSRPRCASAHLRPLAFANTLILHNLRTLATNNRERCGLKAR